MKIAIKFDKQGNYVSHCNDLTITDLEQVVPSNEGFAFYETNLDISDINYFKLVNDKIVLDEQRKASDLDKIAAMRLEQEVQQQKQEMQMRLTELSKDMAQEQAGEIVPNIAERKAEFVRIHNELRVLENKQPRLVTR